ncbi:unnamed protein product, partial [Amoebophrya sp. A25]
RFKRKRETAQSSRGLFTSRPLRKKLRRRGEVGLEETCAKRRRVIDLSIAENYTSNSV